jgi:hypothetical protein
MGGFSLPRHVIERFERRWASRFPSQVVAWRSEEPVRSNAQEVLSRAGRLIPVTYRRAPSCSGAEKPVRRTA